MSTPDFENILRHVVFYGDSKLGTENIPYLLRKVAAWFESQKIYTYDPPRLIFEEEDGEWLVSVTHDFENITLEKVKEKLNE